MMSKPVKSMEFDAYVEAEMIIMEVVEDLIVTGSFASAISEDYVAKEIRKMAAFKIIDRVQRGEYDLLQFNKVVEMMSLYIRRWWWPKN